MNWKRPEDFTDVLKNYADDEMAQARNGNPYNIPPEYFDDPHFREVWYVGLWLNVRLKRLGVPMSKIRQICRANGTHLVKGLDPWEVTLNRMDQIAVEASLDKTNS